MESESSKPPEQPPLIPPQWWVDRWNASGYRGAPYATALDPLVMMGWQFATELPPFRLPLTGI